MSIFLLFLGSFILYGKSIFFPEYLSLCGNKIKQNKRVTTFVGYLFILSSMFLLGSQFGWGTGSVIFFIELTFTYSLLVIVLPLNKNLVYILSIFFISLLIILETNI